MAERSLMKGWSQGGALSADSDVTVPEIRYHGNATAGGDPRRIAQLKAVRRSTIGVMTHGLAMAANGLHGVLAGIGQQLQCTASELLAKLVMQRDCKLEVATTELQSIKPLSQAFGQWQAVGC